ncbi:PAS domain-containing protein [Natronorubrum bangense]
MSERTGPSNMEFWAGDDDRTALHCCQALVETIEGGVFQLDADGQFVAADETFLEMTGYGRIDLFGQHVSTLLSFRGVAQFERDVRAQWPSGGDGVTALTGMIETVDGTTVHCDIRLNQLQTDGCPQGSVGVVQKSIERMLARSTIRRRKPSLARRLRRSRKPTSVCSSSTRSSTSHGSTRRLSSTSASIAQLSSDSRSDS